MSKIYIDLATKTGWAKIDVVLGEEIITSGFIEFNKDRTQRPITILSLQEQLRKLRKFMYDNNKSDVYIEAPAVSFGKLNVNSLVKQYSFYGIVALEIKDYREINPSSWFKFISNKYPHLIVYDDTARAKKIDRKKTSVSIASHVLKKEIKDHNEADAINMLLFDNQYLLEE